MLAVRCWSWMMLMAKCDDMDGKVGVSCLPYLDRSDSRPGASRQIGLRDHLTERRPKTKQQLFPLQSQLLDFSPSLPPPRHLITSSTLRMTLPTQMHDGSICKSTLAMALCGTASAWDSNDSLLASNSIPESASSS